MDCDPDTDTDSGPGARVSGAIVSKAKPAIPTGPTVPGGGGGGGATRFQFD